MLKCSISSKEPREGEYVALCPHALAEESVHVVNAEGSNLTFQSQVVQYFVMCDSCLNYALTGDVFECDVSHFMKWTDGVLKRPSRTQAHEWN